MRPKAKIATTTQKKNFRQHGLYICHKMQTYTNKKSHKTHMQTDPAPTKSTNKSHYVMGMSQQELWQAQQPRPSTAAQQILENKWKNYVALNLNYS